MIAIQNEQGDFAQKWISFCQKNGIAYKIVDCYNNSIIEQLKDCDALMWQPHQNNPIDILMSKQLLYALKNMGVRTFPDFNSVWHFDDKVGQKYLLEAIAAPLVKSQVFFEKATALAWVNETHFPKVFKLRGGAGSQNVRLVRSAREARGLINKAFGKGISAYNAFGSLKERWRKYLIGKIKFGEVLSGVARLVKPPAYALVNGREKGYVYFQDFIPNNKYDIRVTYVFNRCFAFSRQVRPGDFRASGSGVLDYDSSKIPKKALTIAFEVAHKIKVQVAAFDFVLNNGAPEIVELSYGFRYPEKVFELGYWDDQLRFHPGTFNPYGWMVEGVLACETVLKTTCSE